MIKQSLVLMLCLTTCAHGAGIPTIDVPGLAPALISAAQNVQQVQEQINSVTKLGQQLEQQFKQFEAMTGSYDMSDLLNSDAYREARRFVPGEWDDTVDLIEGLYSGGGLDALDGYINRAREEDILHSVDDLYADPESYSAQQYVKDTNATIAHLGIGKSHYSRSLERIEDFETLTSEIDSATDLKAAIDLQNRIQAEHGIAVAELLRLQSAMQINESERRADEHNLKAADIMMSSGIIPSF